MKVIGKANKYYTLWEQQTSKETGVQEYYYLRNISESQEEAFRKFPEAPYYEWLRGKGKFIKDDNQKPVEWESGKMNFGKYAGQNLEDIPESYLIWLLENQTDDLKTMHRTWWNSAFPVMVSILEKAGYIVFEDEYSTIVAAEREVIRKTNIENQIENNEILSIPALSNLDEFGYLRSANVVLKFPYYKTMNYQGSYYSLPVKDSRGSKGIRIKGKMLKITEYDVDIKNAVFRHNSVVYTKYIIVTVRSFEVA